MSAALAYPQPHHTPHMSVHKSDSTPTAQPFPFFQVLRFFKAFCREHAEVKSTHRSMFYFLLEVVEYRSNLARFQLNREDGMDGAGIGSKTTYYNVLKELHAWGLIVYTPGANGEKSAIIEVLPNKSTVPEVGQWGGRCKDADRDTAWDAGGTTKRTYNLETLDPESGTLARAQKKIAGLEKEVARLMAQASAAHTRGGAAAEPEGPVPPPPMDEDAKPRGGFIDPRLADDNPRKWDEIPRDAAMVDEFLANHANPKLRAQAGKGHLFYNHYATSGWVWGQYHTPVRNWRHLIQSFQFREPTSFPHAHASSKHRPAGGRSAAQASRSASAHQPIAEGHSAGPALTGTLDDL